MDPNSDQDSHDPGPDEQKVRVQSGTTGAKMAAEGAAQHSSERGAPASDIANNNPTTNTTTNTTTGAVDPRRQINRDSWSGLQVVEPGLSGLEVSHSELPEALPPSDPETQYVEYKAWGDNSPPPQVVAAAGGRGGAYPFPEAVSPGGDNAYTPISQPYSKTSSATYGGGHNPFDGEKQPQAAADRRICGLRRMVFWCVLAVAIFVVVAAVAVGVGVGLGTRNDSSSANSTSTATSTHSVPWATATAVAAPSQSVLCPYANRTVYSLEDKPDKSFLVLCGRDYNSCCGAVDMLTVNTTSFEDCLEQCGGQEGCTAVGWGNYYGVNTCWLKSAWGEPNWSGSWYAAVLVDSE